MKAWVIMSYWFGAGMTAKYGEVAKVETVVLTSMENAHDVEREVFERVSRTENFCYTDVVETTVTE